MSRRAIRVRVLSTLAELREIENEWNELWLRCPQATTFQRPDWLLPWTEVFAPHRLWTLEARREHTLVGLAPLFLYGTNGDRILAPLGAGISDYLDLLLDPIAAPDTLEALTQYLEHWSSEWTELDFPDLPPSSALVRTRIGSALDHQLEFYNACPRLPLPDSIEELRTAVPPKQVRNLRVSRRQIEVDGPAQVEIATSEGIPEFLTSLFDLHAKRWRINGEPGVLADPAVQELYRRIAPRMLQRGVLRLMGLRFRGKLVACLLAFFEQEVAYLYMQGYDPELSRYSPGAQLIGFLIEQAIREGKHTADFLRGREPYKYFWGARDVATFRLQAVSHLRVRSKAIEKTAA